jgi:DNA topoisomerase I
MARLKRLTRRDLTIERRRHGKGYSYLTPDGEPLRDKAFLARVRGLGIPPAWTEVRVAEHPRGHLQACGLDAAGRLQYIYHPDWERRRAARKLRQLTLLAGALPRIRRHVREDLQSEAGSRQLALALGVALIDRTAMRVGRERYLDANGTRGAGTLYGRDVAVSQDKVLIRFPSKSGKQATYAVNDPKLAAAITRIKTVPGRRLLMYYDDTGKARPLRTAELNAYLQSISGVPVSAKDFRTLHASALAGEALARLEVGPSETARRKQIAGVTREVASFLQNTPLICRKSYIAPCLFNLFDEGTLGELWVRGGDGSNGLRQREKRLGALLESLVPPTSEPGPVKRSP